MFYGAFFEVSSDTPHVSSLQAESCFLYIRAIVKQTDYHSATGLNYIATYAGVEQEAWVWEQSWEQAKVPLVAGLEHPERHFGASLEQPERPFRASLEQPERMFRADVDPFHSTCEATFV